MADFKKLKDGQGNFYNVKDETARTNLASHTGNTSNPHSVTKAQVGLGNVDNTSDANKPISNAQAAVNETKFDKANVKATPASTPSNDNVVSEKYSEETYAKKDGYYETFGYAREAGIAKNLQNDEGKLLDPDVETSSGTIYADQPFTQRATAMTMNSYLNNELISVGSGYEQWKKEQAFSIVKNQYVPDNKKSYSNVLTDTRTTTQLMVQVLASEQVQYGSLLNVISSAGIYQYVISVPSNINGDTLKIKHNGESEDLPFTDISMPVIANHKIFLTITLTGVNPSIAGGLTSKDLSVIDLTQWFASRPEIATALNGDAGIKWFLQNYPQATTLGYDEGTIVDTEDYEYQTTGVNLWDEEWELGIYSIANGEKLDNSTQIRSKNAIAVLPNTQYYLYVGSNVSTISLFYDTDNNLITNVEDGNNYMTVINRVFTTPSNAHSMRFYMLEPYGTTYKHDIQICQHFTETSVEQTYHPYEIYKDRVSWAFTSTGKGKSAGKVADTKDYVNKKNIEKVGRVDLGTLDWLYVTSGKTRFNSSPIDDIVKISGDTTVGNIICPIYLTGSPSEVYTGSAGIATKDKVLWVYNTSYTDATSFKTAMSGVYLYYELETPIETDMSGDELDTNIPENDYGVERKVPVSGNMFSGSSTTIFYQDNVLRQIFNNKTSIDNLQEAVNNIEVKIPTVPTADGTYTLKAVVSNGVVTYSWTLDSQGV